MRHATSAVLLPTLLAALTGAATPVQAAPVNISNAAFAASYVRDCRTAAERAASVSTPSLCGETDALGFQNTLVERRYNLQLGGTSAAASATNPLGITARGATGGSVDASGAAGVLSLHQGGFSSTPYARVSGHTEALQSYTWDGTGAAARSILGHVDFTASHLMSQADFNLVTAAPANLVQARITVFSLDNPSFSYDSDLIPSSGNLYLEAEPRPDYVIEAESFITDVTTPSLDWVVDFNMVVGRTYFINAWLGTWAKFGAEIDASHTFTATLGQGSTVAAFAPTVQGLTAAAPLASPVVNSNAVPEPATPWLVLPALGALLFRRR